MYSFMARLHLGCISSSSCCSCSWPAAYMRFGLFGCLQLSKKYAGRKKRSKNQSATQLIHLNLTKSEKIPGNDLRDFEILRMSTERNQSSSTAAPAAGRVRLMVAGRAEGRRGAGGSVCVVPGLGPVKLSKQITGHPGHVGGNPCELWLK